jgi:hypothetical protein
MSEIKFTPTNFDGQPWTIDDNPQLSGLIYLNVLDQGAGSIGGWVRPEVAQLVKDAPAMLELLRTIFAEYHSTYDGVSLSANIPVEMLERVRALLGVRK